MWQPASEEFVGEWIHIRVGSPFTVHLKLSWQVYPNIKKKVQKKKNVWLEPYQIPLSYKIFWEMILKSIASIKKKIPLGPFPLFRRLQKSSTILRVPQRPSLSSEVLLHPKPEWALEVQVEMSLLAWMEVAAILLSCPLGAQKLRRCPSVMWNFQKNLLKTKL